MLQGTIERDAYPETFPLTTEEAKAHMRVTSSAEDDYIESLIQMASFHVEERTHRSLLEQTWKLYLDRFPSLSEDAYQRVYLLRPPVQSVEKVYYLDTDGVEQEVDDADYRLVKVGGRPYICPIVDGEWPETQDGALSAVRVEYTAGYETVPPPVKQAVLLYVATWYQYRELVISGVSVDKLPAPYGADALLAPFSVRVIR